MADGEARPTAGPADVGGRPASRRAQILDAALAIADSRGLGAVTMRAVGRQLGVTAMALYPHVRSKEDLLDGLVGRLLGELDIPDPALPWPDRLRAIAGSLRQAGQRHPGVMPLLFNRPAVTPDAARAVDAVYLALLDAGVPPRQVPRIERLISTFAIGYVISEISGRFGAADDAQHRDERGQLPAGELPALRMLAAYLTEPWSKDAEFDADLENLTAVVVSAAQAGR